MSEVLLLVAQPRVLESERDLRRGRGEELDVAVVELLIGEPTYEAVKNYVAVELAPGIQLKGKSAETFKIYRAVAIRQDEQSPWVPFPTYAATVGTQVYTQETVLGAGATAIRENPTQGPS